MPQVDTPMGHKQRRSSEFVVGAVLGGAIILFVGTGSMVLTPALQRMRGGTGLIDQGLLAAMLLNIAAAGFWRMA